MTLENAAEILWNYASKKALEQGKTVQAIWEDLIRTDKKFQGMIEGYLNVRERAERERTGKNVSQ